MDYQFNQINEQIKTFREFLYIAKKLEFKILPRLKHLDFLLTSWTLLLQYPSPILDFVTPPE